eukprot:g33645.t1
MNTIPYPSPGGYLRLTTEDVESPEVPQQWRLAQKALQVFGFTSMWWCSAILVILQIKEVVEDLFPYPFALTAMVQPTTALCAFLLTKIVYARRTAQPPLQGHEMVYVVLIGTVQGFEIGLTNKALEYLSVAARTMISSTSVLFMMCTARLWGLERLGLLRLCSSTLMILGGVAQCESPQPSNRLPGTRMMHLAPRARVRRARRLFRAMWTGVEWLGILMQLTSMLLSAQRWAMAQVVLQSPRGLRGVSKLSLLARTLPITGAISMVLACIFEPNAMQALLNQNQTTTLQLLLRVVLVAVGLTSMLFAELNLVSLLSAVAFNVLSTLHQIPIVLAGVVFQHNTVSESSVLGFTCCIFGALVYAVARYNETG